MKNYLKFLILLVTTIVIGSFSNPTYGQDSIKKTEVVVQHGKKSTNLDTIPYNADSVPELHTPNLPTTPIETANLNIGWMVLVVVLSQLIVLFSDAVKHTGEKWNTAVFIRTKIIPFLLNTVIFTIFLILLIRFPQLEQYIKTIYKLDVLSVATLFGVSQTIVDGLYKKFKQNLDKQADEVILS